jgi:hypothetical protein
MYTWEAMHVHVHVAVLALLGALLPCVAASHLAAALKCPKGTPSTSVVPRWYQKRLPGQQLSQWHYDGASPFATDKIRVSGYIEKQRIPTGAVCFY